MFPGVANASATTPVRAPHVTAPTYSTLVRCMHRRARPGGTRAGNAVAHAASYHFRGDQLQFHRSLHLRLYIVPVFGRGWPLSPGAYAQVLSLEERQGYERHIGRKQLSAGPKCFAGLKKRANRLESTWIWWNSTCHHEQTHYMARQHELQTHRAA